MVTRTVQVRIPQGSYEVMMKLLRDGENVSDYVRKAVSLENKVRLLADELKGK